MLKPVLFVAAALAVLVWIGHAKATQEVKNPGVVVNWPLLCQDRDTLIHSIERDGGFPVWHGVRNNTFLTTLYLKADGSWIITEERAKSKTACIFVFGEQNELLGIGGI